MYGCRCHTLLSRLVTPCDGCKPSCHSLPSLLSPLPPTVTARHPSCHSLTSLLSQVVSSGAGSGQKRVDMNFTDNAARHGADPSMVSNSCCGISLAVVLLWQ